MAIGIVTIPRLVRTLGVDRFGILTLCWIVMGYFSLFDLGLGRALTQVVAERTGTGDHLELPDIIRTALAMMLLLGLLGGTMIAIGSPFVIKHILKMPAQLRLETTSAFLLMACSIPAVTLMAGLRGILEARQKFVEISILRLGMGILTFLGPWLVSFRTTNLFWVVMSLEGMRYGALLAHYRICVDGVPEVKAGGTFHARHWKTLLRFGGWMTVSNVISPLMHNLDRFFIGGFLSVGAIAYYSTPFDMITKVFLLSNSVVTVLFPLFGSLYLIDPNQTCKLYNKGLLMIFIMLSPVLLIAGIGSRFFLFHWLGPEFAIQSSPILQVLCIGVLINALAAVPFAYIQGAGRPDLTAKFHMAEAPLYFALLWILVLKFGVIGVAWTWTIRVSLDFILLCLAARAMQSHARSNQHLITTNAPAPQTGSPHQDFADGRESIP